MNPMKHCYCCGLTYYSNIMVMQKIQCPSCDAVYEVPVASHHRAGTKTIWSCRLCSPKKWGHCDAKLEVWRVDDRVWG